MGRGRSKINHLEVVKRSGVDTDMREGLGATTATALLVQGINNWRNAAGEDRAKVRDQVSSLLNDIKAGQQISTYTADIKGRRDVNDLNTANNVIVWTKQKDGTWRSDRGDRRDNKAMMKGLIFSQRVVAPGKITTDSHVKITGKPGKEYNGLRYASGTYDVLKTGNIPRMGAFKFEQKGMITTYNGVKYGVAKDPAGDYIVTHIPTGAQANYNFTNRKLRTYNDVSEHIKFVDKAIRQNGNGLRIKEQEKRFKKTIRHE